MCVRESEKEKAGRKTRRDIDGGEKRKKESSVDPTGR